MQLRTALSSLTAGRHARSQELLRTPVATRQCRSKHTHAHLEPVAAVGRPLAPARHDVIRVREIRLPYKLGRAREPAQKGDYAPPPEPQLLHQDCAPDQGRRPDDGRTSH